MRRFSRLATAALAVLSLVTISTAVLSQAPVKQIQLNEKQIEGFLAAQKDMSAAVAKMQGSTSDRPDPKIQAELQAIAMKHGFKDFSEYGDVAANISMVMAGIDPQTKVFVEPRQVIERELEEFRNDKSMPEKERKQMLDELNEALKVSQAVRFPGNIDLVKKHYDRIDAALR